MKLSMKTNLFKVNNLMGFLKFIENLNLNNEEKINIITNNNFVKLKADDNIWGYPTELPVTDDTEYSFDLFVKKLQEFLYDEFPVVLEEVNDDKVTVTIIKPNAVYYNTYN